MQQSSPLPKLTLPPGKELWELSKAENWPELETLLRAFDGFYTPNSTAENHLLLEIRLPFDACRYPGTPGRSFIASLLVASGMHEEAYAAELLRRLLALGLHPDLQTSGGGARWRPSHYCSWNNRKEAAEVLGVCRPDLGAKDVGGDTPRAIGGHAGEHLWRVFEREGFPTIARLASDKKWWAVKNLTRRRVVSEDEKFTPYKGKTAIQWAKQHGELQEAEELNYLLISGPSPPMSRTASCVELGPQLQAVTEKIASLQEKIDREHERTTKLNAIVEEHQRKLMEVVLKGEADELKEGIACCLIKMTEEAASMQKDLEVVCEAAIGKERLKHQEEIKALKADLLDKLTDERENLRKEAEDLQRALQVQLNSTIDENLLNLKEELRRQVSEMITGTLLPTLPVLKAQPVPESNVATGSSSVEKETPADEPNPENEDQDPLSSEAAAANPPNYYDVPGFAQDFLVLVNKYKKS